MDISFLFAFSAFFFKREKENNHHPLSYFFSFLVQTQTPAGLYASYRCSPRSSSLDSGDILQFLLGEVLCPLTGVHRNEPFVVLLRHFTTPLSSKSACVDHHIFLLRRQADLLSTWLCLNARLATRFFSSKGLHNTLVPFLLCI